MTIGPVVQWIECKLAEFVMQVRFLPGSQNEYLEFCDGQSATARGGVADFFSRKRSVTTKKLWKKIRKY